MVHTNSEVCHFILQAKHAAILQRHESQDRTSPSDLGELRSRPINRPPLSDFRNRLDEMAEEIDALVRSSDKVVLYKWRYYEGYSDADSSETLERHSLCEKLGLFEASKRFKEFTQRRNESRLTMFQAWIMCRYVGLVHITIETNDPTDYYSDEAYCFVEMVW